MCEFCKIINKQELAHIVYENGKVMAFLDIEPINEGHVLIVPKEHVDSIDKLPEAVLLDVMKTAQNVVKALREIYGIKGYSIMQNGGMFCDFGHAHFHVFPRYENDGFGFTYPEGESEYSAKVAKKLREKLVNVKFSNVEDVNDEEFKLAVIIAKHKGKLVLCKHKNRCTWELPGGHREDGETILETAKRELYEETGAVKFEIKEICAYKITRYGMLFYAEIEEFDALPESEMKKIELFDELPYNITYPTIHQEFYYKVIGLL